MNKRILELAEQAGLYVDLNGRPWPRAMSAEECEAAYQKFAESIVRECAQVAEEVDGDSRARKCVLEHFGVESQARFDQEAAEFIAAEDKKFASRYGYFPKLHPSQWQDK